MTNRVFRFCSALAVLTCVTGALAQKMDYIMVTATNNGGFDYEVTFIDTVANVSGIATVRAHQGWPVRLKSNGTLDDGYGSVRVCVKGASACSNFGLLRNGEKFLF